MNWLDEYLQDDEEVIFRTRTQRLWFLVPAAMTGLAWVRLFFLFAGIAAGIVLAARYCYYEYVITDRRVMIKKGLFKAHIADIPIALIEDVLIRRSYFDKFIGGGTVVIFGKEIATRKLSGLHKPATFRDALYSLITASTLSYYEDG